MFGAIIAGPQYARRPPTMISADIDSTNTKPIPGPPFQSSNEKLFSGSFIRNPHNENPELLEVK
jgi:hypothetical protein